MLESKRALIDIQGGRMRIQALLPMSTRDFHPVGVGIGAEWVARMHLTSSHHPEKLKLSRCFSQKCNPGAKRSMPLLHQQSSEVQPTWRQTLKLRRGAYWSKSLSDLWQIYKFDESSLRSPKEPTNGSKSWYLRSETKKNRHTFRTVTYSNLVSCTTV